MCFYELYWENKCKKGLYDEYNIFYDFYDREIEVYILVLFLIYIGVISLKGQFEVL